MAIKSKILANDQFNPVYRLALKNKFKDSDVESMLEVCYSTPNTDIAIQMLLGIYEKPNLQEYVLSDNGKILRLKSVNFFSERVICSYKTNKTEYFYFPKGTDVSQLTHENYMDLKESWSHSKEQVQHKIVFPELVDAVEEHSISKWKTFEKYVEKQDQE